MKIGLIFPNKDRKDKTVHLGLGYLAAYARQVHSDIDIMVLDTRVALKRESEAFYNTEFDLVGITALSPVFYEVIEIIKYYKNNKPHIPVCLGGPYVTTLMDEVFEYIPADYAVYGEGEITFSELISYFKNERSIEEIKGLMYKTNTGDVVVNFPRPQINDLDKLPLPAYDLFKMNRYPMHRLVTSRGCPYTCSFCNSSSIWSGKWRKRSAENIVNEINFLLKNYGKKPVFFNDNSFNIDLKRVEELCKILIDCKMKIMWTTPVRPDIINKNVAELMKRSGCYNVGIGVESANNDILKRMNKKTTIEEINKGIEIFKKAGIEVLGQFVIGSPGDTLETIKESIEWAENSLLDYVMFYSVLPFKGTPQWDYVLNSGKMFNDKIHEFHNIKPRIVFETPEFTYEQRLKAISLASDKGYYSDSNDKNILFDYGKKFANIIINVFPYRMSSRIYLFLKNFYRKKITPINNKSI